MIATTKQPTTLSRRWNMRFSKAIDTFIADLEAAKKSPATRHGYQTDLLKLLPLLRRDTVLDITPEALRDAMRTWSSQGLAQNTLFRRQTAIRAFCRWARKQRMWAENPTDLMDTIGQAECLPRPFEREEADRIWALELPPVEDLCRALLLFTGLRVEGVCSLTIAAVSADMSQLRAMGKRGRVQMIEVHPILADKLAAHLLTRQGAKPYDPLLARPSGLRISRRTVEKWTQRWGQAVNVLHCTPHRFRHLFGSELLESTGNLRTVQEAMGHASIRSTQIYTRVRSSTVRAAILTLPWGGNTAPNIAPNTTRLTD